MGGIFDMKQQYQISFKLTRSYLELVFAEAPLLKNFYTQKPNYTPTWNNVSVSFTQQ
jgi:hypothetical protein